MPPASLALIWMPRNSFSVTARTGTKKHFVFLILGHGDSPPSPPFLVICTNLFEFLLSYEVFGGGKKKKKPNIFEIALKRWGRGGTKHILESYTIC